MTPNDVLRNVRDLIARGWCQRVWAKDADGNTVLPNNPRAIAWCLSGAFYSLVTATAQNVWQEAYNCVFDLLPGPYGSARDSEFRIGVGMVPYNDAPGRTRDDVLELLNRAIDSLETRGGR